METQGLMSAGRVLFGTSLLTDQAFSIAGLPSAPEAAEQGQLQDTYVGPRASVGADHESLKTPGTTPHTAVMKQIEDIAGNPQLTDKQKRATINDLRKQLGLSKGDMKKIYMKPLEQKAAQEGDEAKKGLYASMYKAGGCVKKAFKGIGKGLSIAAKVATVAASAIVNPASLIPVAISLASKIPGVSKVTGAVQGAVEKATGWAEKGVGYVQKGVQFSKDMASIFGSFGGLG